jgi:flagellar basal body-associated protein FliL
VSTILKALRRLEEEKASAESGRPLREQIAAAAPRPPERSGRGWLSAVLALVVSALAGGGLIWWLYGDRQNAGGEQVAAAPAAEAPAPTLRELAPPPEARPAAPATPPGNAFASDVDVVRRPERIPRLADEAPLRTNTAPKPGARRPVEDSAAMARANAQAQAQIDQRADMERLLTEAAPPPPSEPVVREAAPPPAPVSRRDPAPVVAKAEPAPKPAPVAPKVEPAPAPEPAPRVEPTVVATAPAPEPDPPAPKPAPRAEPAPATPSAFASLLVEKTQWHPLADRRSAQLRVGAEGASREVVEGDVVDGALVAEIQPSGVVFERDGESTRRGVGEK